MLAFAVLTFEIMNELDARSVLLNMSAQSRGVHRWHVLAELANLVSLIDSIN
jgi:hypothetical protein